jgi:hypothetical protein
MFRSVFAPDPAHKKNPPSGGVFSQMKSGLSVGRTYEGFSATASGYTGVWATDNTRKALFDAMKRKKVYATTGPRMLVRFWGGWVFVSFSTSLSLQLEFRCCIDRLKSQTKSRYLEKHGVEAYCEQIVYYHLLFTGIY